MPVLSSSNIFILSRATQPNINAVTPMGIFMWGPMWPIPNRWLYIYCQYAYSRYSDVVLLKDTSSKSLIKELESIFSRYGYPLKTDNGPNLVSVEIENYLHLKGIHRAKLTT